MPLFEAVVLGLTQGLTEFLPVSSSAHLRLVPEALGWDDPGASFTAVVQLGTVLAVVLAFRGDLVAIAHAGWQRTTGRSDADDTSWRLAGVLVLGTVPIALAGLVFAEWIETTLRSLAVIVVALIAGSAWIVLAIRRSNGDRPIAAVGTRDAAWVGMAQAAALVPGVSRSGATISAGLLLGLEPPAAARLSFLLSVPAVVLAGLYGLRDVGGDLAILPTLLATVVAFTSGYATIRWLLRLVGQGRLVGFVVYRLALAAVIIVAVSR